MNSTVLNKKTWCNKYLSDCQTIDALLDITAQYIPSSDDMIVIQLNGGQNFLYVQQIQYSFTWVQKILVNVFLHN